MSTETAVPNGRRAHLFVLLACLAAASGCVVKSASPIVPEDSVETDRRLVGAWAGQGGKESAVVTADTLGYLVAYTGEEGKTGRFRARLGRMGPYRVLDLQPDTETLDADDSFTSMLLPLHTFLVVDSIGAELRVRGVQPDSLDHYLAREPTAAAHVRIDGNVVLTASTAELRAFLISFVARPGVLHDSAVWTRR
jgi:hypothetical protein